MLTAVWADVAAVQPLEPVDRVKLRAKSANVSSTRWFYGNFTMIASPCALVEQQQDAQLRSKTDKMHRK
ncbi:hypothetical protein AUC70_02730 [Methyloceanibacter stevinii]|uniref:Uncharacterized protein n=1 Tax=Methyloceanibacter stevinii TaxID=1774970 RepID=A0A1E3VQK8_9HYPH|nr:hypothetical protein [Methyloceanibacter stevinii]ODR95802.1 hypothetical protein AUC70_02730 [Methyloceanibacter stevinii]